MTKKSIIYLQAAALLIYILFSVLLIPDTNISASKSLNDCSDYQQNWTVSTASGSHAYEMLPDFLHTKNEHDIWLTKTLNEVEDGDCIGFFSFQQQVSVNLDGIEIYSFIPSEHIKSSTPGNRWNFIPLSNEYNGKELSIHIRQCYSDSKVSIPKIYYGTQAGIMLSYLKTELPQVIVSFIMILFGIMLSIFCILYRKKTGFERGLTWLAAFAIFRGLWTAIESNIYSFVFTRLLLLSHVSYLCLKLAVVTFLQFVNYSFYGGKSRVLKILASISVIEFWVTAFCQLALGIDFANTVYITHIVLLIGGIYACGSSIHVLTDKKHSSQALAADAVAHRRRRNSYIAQVACTLAIIVTSVTDLIRYYAVNSPDVARYSRWGDLIYVATISITIFIDFISLLHIGHQAEQIKEEALLDPLTKLMNRASFEHDIAEGTKRQWRRKSIVMLDLNNLKYFNDVHGHDMGDYYIIIASEMIEDAFSEYGNVYRIGGDEFCVIGKNLTEEMFMEIRTSLENRIKNLKVPQYDVHMEISAGYASFNPDLDHNLRDTMKRADSLMYKRKLELKKHSDNQYESHR